MLVINGNFLPLEKTQIDRTRIFLSISQIFVETTGDGFKFPRIQELFQSLIRKS